MSAYRTSPAPLQTMPKGIPYIIGNEAAERFSYYGMRAILTIFLTKHLLDSAGRPDFMGKEEAAVWFHLFGLGVYAFPTIGALISDALFGKYRTILALSSVYCLGHGVLAVADSALGRVFMEPRTGFAVGLCLIAVGSGGIKPCVSAHVGDQFGPGNKHLIPNVFRWFYFSINLGATASMLLMEPLLEQFGPQVAFGIPGILMFVATVVFWMGRNKFVHIPPGGRAFLREVFSREGILTLLRLGVLYLIIATFWALFDQSGSSWVLQAERMDRHLFGIQLLSSQLQAANPILVMILIPVFGLGVYPLVGRFIHFTPLRRIGTGLFLTVPAFLIPAYVEHQIQAGEAPSIAWQLLAYLLITAAEVMVSITALEFSYTQAPRKMKSVVMATFFLSMALGNLVTAGTNWFIQNPEPHFYPARPGRYLVELSASDGSLSNATQLEIEVVPALPETSQGAATVDDGLTVDAGEDKVIPAEQRVVLFASARHAAGNPVFQWRIDSKPPTSVLELSAANRAPRLEVVPDVVGEYVFSVSVRDGETEKRDTVTVTASDENAAPRVFAVTTKPGPFELAEARESGIRLDGTASYDPNPGDTLRFEWKVVSGPDDSVGEIRGAEFPGPTSKLEGPAYFLFFAGLMFLTALLFVPAAALYRGRTYIQGDAS